MGLRVDEPTRTASGTGRSTLADLYQQHTGPAMRLAYLLTGERTAAEDLVQDAFIRVASKTSRLENDAAFAAYLRRTIINLHTSRLRRHKVERAYLAREAGQPLPDSRLPDIDLQDDLRERLLRLPPRQRAALVLRFYEDLSESDTAEVMRCSPGAVKSLTARGLRALRIELRGDT